MVTISQRISPVASPLLAQIATSIVSQGHPCCVKCYSPVKLLLVSITRDLQAKK